MDRKMFTISRDYDEKCPRHGDMTHNGEDLVDANGQLMVLKRGLIAHFCSSCITERADDEGISDDEILEYIYVDRWPDIKEHYEKAT